MSRICKSCGWEIDEENEKWQGLLCYDCYKTYQSKAQKDVRDERKYWNNEIPLYGSTSVRTKPGEWYDDKQKEYVHDILKSIGWKYNEEKNVWYDEKIRNKEGEWIVDVTTKYTARTHHGGTKEYLQRHPEELPRFKILKHKHLSDKLVRDIQVDYFINNYTQNKCIMKHQISEKDMQYILRRTYDKLNNSK